MLGKEGEGYRIQIYSHTASFQTCGFDSSAYNLRHLFSRLAKLAGDSLRMSLAGLGLGRSLLPQQQLPPLPHHPPHRAFGDTGAATLRDARRSLPSGRALRGPVGRAPQHEAGRLLTDPRIVLRRSPAHR